MAPALARRKRGDSLCCRRGRLWSAMFSLHALATLLHLVSVCNGIKIKSKDYSAEQIWSHVKEPMAVRFAPDERVYVSTKAGIIWEFESISDPTGRVIVDLSEQVYDYWDRGMLGLAVHPQFPQMPYLYVLYTGDSAANGPLTPPLYNDRCVDGSGLCQASIVLSRIALDGEETVMYHGNCHSSPSHNAGEVFFVPGESPPALYVSLGDGAHFDYIDTGQTDTCGLQPGGAFRAQDGSHLYGAILRVDPMTGLGMKGNPFDIGVDSRIYARGLRNPYRIGVDTFNNRNDLYIGDVGWATWEEINVIPSGTKTLLNFGWPCYEGNVINDPYASLNLPVCRTLLNSGIDVKPWYVYNHNKVSLAAGDDGCSAPGESSVTSMAVNDPNRGGIPDATAGALFFGDYARKCMWYFPRSKDGTVSKTPTFFAKAVEITDLVFHGGIMYVTEVMKNSIWAVKNVKVTVQPTRAIVTASAVFGVAPMTVTFDGSQSVGNTALTFAWANAVGGAYSADGSVISRTFSSPGTYTVGLKVATTTGSSATASVVVVVVQSLVLSIPQPRYNLDRWRVGDTVPVAALAAYDGKNADPVAMQITMKMRHCMYDGCSLRFGTCHEHLIEQFALSERASFNVPNHEYPSMIVVQLAATFTLVDGSTATQTKQIEFIPHVAQIIVRSNPPGLTMLVSNRYCVSPCEVHALAGGYVNIVAISNQKLGSLTYAFSAWSDGSTVASRSMDVGRDTTSMEITAQFQKTLVTAIDIAAVNICPSNYV